MHLIDFNSTPGIKRIYPNLTQCVLTDVKQRRQYVVMDEPFTDNELTWSALFLLDGNHYLMINYDVKDIVNVHFFSSGLKCPERVNYRHYSTSPECMSIPRTLMDTVLFLMTDDLGNIRMTEKARRQSLIATLLDEFQEEADVVRYASIYHLGRSLEYTVTISPKRKMITLRLTNDDIIEIPFERFELQTVITAVLDWLRN